MLALERNEGLGVGIRVDALLLAIADILAAHHLGRVDRQQRAEHLVLLLADRSRRERGRRLHRHEGEDLEEVGDDHVAKGAGLLVEGDAVADIERLGHVDLHVVDEVAVPDRLEEAIGEAEGEDVLRRLLAKEMVDAEDLLLVENLVQLCVQRTAVSRSVPNGFSMMIREPLARSASSSIRTAFSAALGGTLR